MYEILIITFLVVALAIIVLVLIQRGKGADMGSSFGAGASATLFGSSGSGNVLTRLTTGLGILFFVISLALANLGAKGTSNSSNFYNIADDSTEASQQLDIPDSDYSIPANNAESTHPTDDIPE